MPTKSIVLERKGEKDGFAQRFGKVIPDGSLIFLEGKEGAGKSIFCQRFCYSLLRHGSACSYVSKYLMAGKLFFISTEVMLAETLPKSTFLEGLTTCKKLFEPEIIFIDSLSTLLSKSLNEGNLVDLTNFFNRLKGSGKSIMITGNPNEWSDEIHSAFQMICDIHFKVTRESMPGIGIVHNIYLEKFNGAPYRYDPKTTFSVRPGVGLTIETTGVAF
jgi:flagellar protein FlaH